MLLCGLDTGLEYFGGEHGFFLSFSKTSASSYHREICINYVSRGTLKKVSIDSVMWLLAVTLMKIYNAKEKVDQGTIKNNVPINNYIITLFITVATDF